MRASEYSFTPTKYYQLSRASNSCTPALSPISVQIMGHCQIECYYSDFGQG